MYVVLTQKQQPRSYDNTRLYTTLHNHPNDILTLVIRYQLDLAASYFKHPIHAPDARRFRPTIHSSVILVTRYVPDFVPTTTTRLLGYIEHVPVVDICLNLHSTDEIEKM